MFEPVGVQEDDRLVDVEEAWDAVRAAVGDRVGDDGHVTMASPVVYGFGKRAH
ncbi:MAG TPA: hypothetical protein VNT22_07825 [Baekduia sp.]|nr:hypothetical protein [Baekduia sp.]